MAFTRMSAGYPYCIRTLAQGCQHEFYAHPARTGNSDNPDIRRILHSAYTGEISCTIAAPVAKKAYDFGFFFRHLYRSLFLSASDIVLSVLFQKHLM